MYKNICKQVLIRKKNKILNMLSVYFSQIGKKIVFESFNGLQYSDNPRAISEKMHNMYPDYKLIWGLKKNKIGKINNIPNYVEIIPINSWKYRKARAGAIAYVRNEVMTDDLYKRRNQLFIQTWHGDRGIKKILIDSINDRGIPSEMFGYAEDKLTDLFIIGSDYAEKRITTAFNYKGRTQKTGCPRNDCLINNSDNSLIRGSLGITPQQKIILYAPTLRRNESVFTGKIDIRETLQHFNKRGDDWICLVRAHPKSLGLNIDAIPNVIDVSSYPDMADLLMISDVLITDYSSCAGDFIIKQKLVILAQFDLGQYLNEDRTFYVPPDEIGFFIAKNQNELNHYIDTMTDEKITENCKKIMDFFGTNETGHSAEDVCKFIDDHYRKFINS